VSLREVHDVLRGSWNTAVLCDGRLLRGRSHEIDMIDRFGAGDSWSAGFLHGRLAPSNIASEVVAAFLRGS